MSSIGKKRKNYFLCYIKVRLNSMQVSKTLDYAVRSLSYMASSRDENITIKLVSEKQHIPHSYLAKIMRKLVQRGILSSSSGPDGGYYFKKDPMNISLKEVYEAIEGDLQLIDCMDGDQVCELFKTCNQRSVWDHLQLNTLEFLSKITVKDLASNKFNT
tara:strand:- start:1922 stop:2398 length:477 start_codon:yes stop_codon:yes gene_type:complete